MSNRTTKHVYLSPHFDDVVYSCGGNIDKQVQHGEDVLVITVFGGSPPDDRFSPVARSLHAQWGLGRDAPEHRAKEDRQALITLGADFEYWDFIDALYRRTGEQDYYYATFEKLYAQPHPSDEPLVEQITSRVLKALSGRESTVIVYGPLGVGGHVDHVIVSEAARKVFGHGVQVLFYEDQPYAGKSPEFLGQVLITKSMSWWKPMVVPISIEHKLRALTCYTSQGMDDKQNQHKIRAYANHVTGNRGIAERLWVLVKRQRPSIDEWAEVLACPSCRGRLHHREAFWQCLNCGKDYPIHYGIPDFRVSDTTQADHLLFIEKDLEKARLLLQMYKESSFEELASHYSQTNKTFPGADKKYRQCLASIQPDTSDLLGKWISFSTELRSSWAKGAGLDVDCNCGTGLLSLAAISPMIVGLDLSLSELVIVKKLLQEHGLAEFAFLVAGTSDALPFRQKTFANVVAQDTYGHVPRRRALLKEAHRVLQPDGLFFFDSPSRFIWTEPHVHLKGLGYLPRFLQPQVVKLLRKETYGVFLPSLWGLKRDTRQALPAGTPVIIKKPIRIQKSGTPNTWKAQFVWGVPGLVNLINRVYGHLGWFEVAVSKRV